MRERWTKPCPGDCGRVCDMLARFCRACSNRARWGARLDPLERVASLPEPPAPEPRARFESYCLLCGRGVGLAGVLVATPQPPSRRAPCEFCGGFVFVREVGDALTHLTNTSNFTAHHARKVA